MSCVAQDAVVSKIMAHVLDHAVSRWSRAENWNDKPLALAMGWLTLL
jgi:hypothetical protein